MNDYTNKPCVDERDYMIYQLHRMCDQLGRTPTCEEYVDRIGSYGYVKRYFGSFNQMLRKCGIPLKEKKTYRMDYDELIMYMVTTYEDTGKFPTVDNIRAAGISVNLIRNTGMTYTQYTEHVKRVYIRD